MAAGLKNMAQLIHCLQKKITFKYNDTARLKTKGWKMTYHTSIN